MGETMKDDGGPAFPVTLHEAEDRFPQTFSGMSLRDWFAGQVLPVVMSTNAPAQTARLAYEHADAMLAARER
jgi:hypothetical protein